MILLIIISIFGWRLFQQIRLSKALNYMLLTYVLVYFGWLYTEVTFNLSFIYDWLDMLFLLFFVFALNYLLSKWVKPALFYIRLVLQISMLYVFLSFYFNLLQNSPILDSMDGGYKITNNSAYSITTRGFVTGFMDQGFVIILNKNLWCFEKAVKYTDGAIHDISDDIVGFYTDDDLNEIHLTFRPNFQMTETYSILPLRNIK